MFKSNGLIGRVIYTNVRPICAPLTRCRDERLACDQIEVFYKIGDVRWKTEPREPSRQIFANIFKIKTGSEGAAAAAETGCGG